MDEQTARRDLIKICHLMYERSYVVSSDGNVSVRLDDSRILATPTMTCKGRMMDDLIAVTDQEGRSLNDRRASSELAMHLLIYRERPDVRAVCHAHPPHGTAFAVAGLPIDQPILSRMLGGSKNLSPDSIEKLINVREAAGYLGEGARCQACGYLHETSLACPTGDRPSRAQSSSSNGDKVSLTREELVELLSEAARLKE